MRARVGMSGLTSIEMIVVLALFGAVVISVVGLHLVALSAGSAAETSSIASNLARARMEELLSLSRDQLKSEDGTEVRRQVPPGQGRTYRVHTAVVDSGPSRLDLAVTVTWEVGHGAACTSAASSERCAGSRVTYARTLQTRVQAPAQP